MRKLAFTVATLALVASVGMADVSFDFDSTTVEDLETAGWVFTDGSNAIDTISIETIITHNGSAGALRMNISDLATFPLDGEYGILDIWVYDFGYLVNEDVGSGTCYGPTWGLQKSENHEWTYPGSVAYAYDYDCGIGAGFCNKSYLNSDGGFAYEQAGTGSMSEILQNIVDQDVLDGDPLTYDEQAILDTQGYQGWGRQSWFSPNWLGGGRGTGWNHFRIAYTEEGLIEVTLVENAGGGGYSQHLIDTSLPEHAATNFRLFGGDGEGVRNMFLWGGSSSIGEWTIGDVTYDENWFGDIIVDDIAWVTTGEEDPHPGDADDDGDVDLDDFITLKQNYNKSPAVWAEGNFNEDDVVNLDDFIILKQNYGWVAN